MSGDDWEERTLLVDASVIITLAAVDTLELVSEIPGSVTVPEPVVREVESEPAATVLSDAIDTGEIVSRQIRSVEFSPVTAASYLGKSLAKDDLGGYGHQDIEGDIALLAIAMAWNDCIVVTDDKPLRKTCKALSIPVSGSLGVLIRAVERDDLEAEVAKDKLYAMDEAGVRLSASLVKKAERMIEDAANDVINGE